MILPSIIYLTILLATVSCNIDDPPPKRPPHILFILVDDLGWDDVSMHGSQQIPTPNIDSLAASGITLNNYYVQPICSPTRSALMTGKYPIHTGMQDQVISFGEPWALSLYEYLLPNYLQDLGYATHAVGKWHLGLWAKEYTPRYRGFDSFMGFYNGGEDYYTHSEDGGLDLRRNGTILHLPGEYNTELFTAEAESLIAANNNSRPMFLYLAHQAPHASYQAPQEWIDKFVHIQDMRRRRLAAMISYLDYGIGRVVKSLKKAKMFDDTIIAFSTDNGGPIHLRGYEYLQASNYPLRGGKTLLWEGGVRGVGFVTGAAFRKRAGHVSNELMHVTDWLPTLVEGAGKDPAWLHNKDGISQWKSLVGGEPSPRKEILLNIKEKNGVLDAALRVGNMKIITGQSNYSDGWYMPLGVEVQKHTVKCGVKPEITTHCSSQQKPCLFDLANDPCEYHDLQGKPEYEATYTMMLQKLEKYRAGAVKPRERPYDPTSNPKLHGGVWMPWVDLQQTNIVDP